MVNRRLVSSSVNTSARSPFRQMSIVNEKNTSSNKRGSSSRRIITVANSTITAPGSSLSSRFSNLKSTPKKNISTGAIRKVTNRRINSFGKPNFKGSKRNNKWKKKSVVPTASSLDAALDSYMMKEPGLAKDKLDADIDAYMSMEVESLGNPGLKAN